MSPAAVLRDRSFRLLWSAHTISSFGDALTSLALLLTAYSIGLAVPWLHARTPGLRLAVIPVPGSSGLAIAGAF